MNEKARFKEIVSILKNGNLIRGMSPQTLCDVIVKLGPTFIKIGQIMSNRYDLLPKEYCDELSKLRSNVKPMSFNEVKNILNEEYDDLNEVFKSISSEYIGSASIAQVHRAILTTGENVVVKVQRPNIYEIMSTDVKLFKKAIRILHLNMIIKAINLKNIIDEMFNAAKEEMDFQIEASHLEEFKENNKDIVYVDVPKVYTNISTKRVLVMEYIEGTPLTEIKRIEKQGYDLKEIALKLANNYIKQALEDGFFHADPHPDNLAVRAGTIVFMDLGMMGRISNRNKILLNNAMKAIISGDIVGLEHILLSLSTIEGPINHIKLRADIQRVLDRNLNENIENINIMEFSNSVYNILSEHKIKIDKNITMLIRGICVIEGTLEMLCPSINLVVIFENKLKEQSIKDVFSKDMIIKTGRSMVNSVNSLSDLPNELLNFVRDLNRGEHKFDIQLANSAQQVNKLEKMLHQLVVGLLDAAVLLGASMVHSQIMKCIYGALAAIFTIWLFIQMLKDHFHNGY